MLKGIKSKLDGPTLTKVIKSLIRSMMEYVDVLWDGCTESESYLGTCNMRLLKC